MVVQLLPKARHAAGHRQSGRLRPAAAQVRPAAAPTLRHGHRRQVLAGKRQLFLLCCFSVVLRFCCVAFPLCCASLAVVPVAVIRCSGCSVFCVLHLSIRSWPTLAFLLFAAVDPASSAESTRPRTPSTPLSPSSLCLSGKEFTWRRIHAFAVVSGHWPVYSCTRQAAEPTAMKVNPGETSALIRRAFRRLPLRR